MSVGEVEFYEVEKGSQVRLSLRSTDHNLGIPMKVETQSDSSMTNSLTDRLGAGPRTKHIIHDTSGYKSEIKIDISLSKVCAAKKIPRMLERSQLQQHCKFAGLVFY